MTTAVPKNITECFRSGTSSPGDLRSSSFDIHFRRFATELGVTYGNETHKNVTGSYMFVGQVVVEPGYHLREGVIIDANNGGLGFRNHTVPDVPRMIDGVTWEEDLLWMEPATTCLRTNWTYYYPSDRRYANFPAMPWNMGLGDGWFEYEHREAEYNWAPRRPDPT